MRTLGLRRWWTQSRRTGLRLGLPLWCRGSLSTTLLARALQEEELRKREEEAKLRKVEKKAKKLQVAKEAAESDEAMLALNARVSAGETLTASEHVAWYRWCAPPHATSSSSSAGNEEEEEEEAEAMDEAVSAQLLFMMFHSFSSFVAARGLQGAYAEVYWLSLRAIVSLWRLRCA